MRANKVFRVKLALLCSGFMLTKWIGMELWAAMSLGYVLLNNTTMSSTYVYIVSYTCLNKIRGISSLIVSIHFDH